MTFTTTPDAPTRAADQPANPSNPSDEVRNPFPGPQPYRDTDRTLFRGRDADAARFERHVLSNACTMLFGPSGSGKSSLVQAAVAPDLVHKFGYRIVRVDAWPETEAPLGWFVRALCTAVPGTGPAAPADPLAAIDEVIARVLAARQPLLIYLDQLEQLLYTGRSTAALLALLDAVDRIVQTPAQELHVVLAMREDYLGRFRDRARSYRMLLENGFRLGPLSVRAMTTAVCEAAARGTPPQRWEPSDVSTLMLQMCESSARPTEDDDVQGAFVQIVFRALWEERRVHGAAAPLSSMNARDIVEGHLTTTLADLGPHAGAAQRLLEEKLVNERGHRTLLTEEEASAAFPPGAATDMLRKLERAAVLHAERYEQGCHYMLGHDWLAKEVFARRKARVEREAAQRRRAEAQEQQRRAADARRRRLWKAGLAAATTVMMLLSMATAVALRQWRRADAQARIADAASVNARYEALSARAASAVAIAGRLGRDDAAAAAVLLAEMPDPEHAPGWRDLALETLWSEIPIATLRGPGSPVRQVEASADDAQRVLTVFDEGAPRIWSLDGRAAVRIAGHARGVRQGAFSADGRWIATSSWDFTARVWNASDASEVARFDHPKAPKSAELARDLRHVVTTCDDNQVRVWSTDAPQQPRASLPDPPGTSARCGKRLSKAAFSPGAPRIVTVSLDGDVCLWDFDDFDSPPTRATVVQHGKGLVYTARFDRSGGRLVTASADRLVRVYDLAAPGAPIELAQPLGLASDAAFSPDGRYVAARAGHDAVLWSADGSGEPRALSGHSGDITSIGFGPAGLLVTASMDGTARLWSVEHATVLAVLPSSAGPVYSAAFNREGTRVVTGSFGDSQVWRVHGWRRPILLAGHTRPINSVAFSPDGRDVVTASDDGNARVWRTDGSGRSAVLVGHLGPITSARFSADGARIVTASKDGTVRLWRTDDPDHPITIVPQDRFNVTSAALDRGATRVVTATTEPGAAVWPVDGPATRQLVLTGHRGVVRSAAFSPDGRRIVTACEDGIVRLFDAGGDGAPIEIGRHAGDVRSARFSPDGRRIVTASADTTVRVWSSDRTGEPLVLDGHTGTVTSAVFSGDGKRIVSASLDGTARIWNADGTGPPIVINVRSASRDMTNHVLSADVTSDASRVVTGSSDGIARIWDISGIDVAMLRDRLREATGRGPRAD